MLKRTILNIKQFDANISGIIQNFLKKYYPPGELPYFSAMLPGFIKIIIYLLPGLFIFTFLKFLHPYNKTLSWILIILLALMAVSVGGLFLGFFQLMFSG